MIPYRKDAPKTTDEKKYSLYRLFGHRWVRVSNDLLTKEEATRRWSGVISQTTFWNKSVVYKIKVVPKENRGKS